LQQGYDLPCEAAGEYRHGTHPRRAHEDDGAGHRQGAAEGRLAGRSSSPWRTSTPHARIGVVDKGGRLLDEAYVNNFGEYALARVPVDQLVTPRAVIAKAWESSGLIPARRRQSAGGLVSMSSISPSPICRRGWIPWWRSQRAR
jgi:hypothetical protein